MFWADWQWAIDVQIILPGRVAPLRCAAAGGQGNRKGCIYLLWQAPTQAVDPPLPVLRQALSPALPEVSRGFPAAASSVRCHCPTFHLP